MNLKDISEERKPGVLFDLEERSILLTPEELEVMNDLQTWDNLWSNHYSNISKKREEDYNTLKEEIETYNHSYIHSDQYKLFKDILQNNSN